MCTATRCELHSEEIFSYFFGWIFLGIVAMSMAWAAFVMVARPEAAKTLGTIIADE